MAGIDHPWTDAPAKETERLFNRSRVLAEGVEAAGGPVGHSRSTRPIPPMWSKWKWVATIPLTPAIDLPHILRITVITASAVPTLPGSITIRPSAPEMM